VFGIFLNELADLLTQSLGCASLSFDLGHIRDGATVDKVSTNDQIIEANKPIEMDQAFGIAISKLVKA
jgi:hypothetical protein